MAYDRYERERRWREGRPEFSDERGSRNREFERDRDERGFFDRMGDEFRSWFGDDESQRRRQWSRDDNWEPRGSRERETPRFPSSDRDERSFDRDSDRSYRPVAGDYARAGRDTPWERDPYRQTRSFESRRQSNFDDSHYEEMRRRQAEDLDRDYDEYRRERASQFENDFGSWRERRMSKRQLLSGIREHMEVVGSDDQHVGTVDRVAGDRIILTKSDPESGGAHHSLMCTSVDRVEGDKVFLDLTAEQSKQAWRDESRSRALFEREDQGRAGPGVLDRSFSGTYR
jgi:hypothetical protein